MGTRLYGTLGDFYLPLLVWVFPTQRTLYFHLSNVFSLFCIPASMTHLLSVMLVSSLRVGYTDSHFLLFCPKKNWANPLKSKINMKIRFQLYMTPPYLAKFHFFHPYMIFVKISVLPFFAFFPPQPQRYKLGQSPLHIWNQRKNGILTIYDTTIFGQILFFPFGPFGLKALNYEFDEKNISRFLIFQILDSCFSRFLLF